MLDSDDDEANVISPEYDTYVDTGATVEIVWNQVDNAEYYAIYTEMRYDSSGTMTYEYDYTFTFDTTNPTSEVSSPGNGEYVQDITGALGTGNDANSLASEIRKVEVSIFQVSN